MARGYPFGIHVANTPGIVIQEDNAMKSILDPAFKYRSSVDTDLRATFARLRRQQRRQTPALAQRTDAAKVVAMQARERAPKA